MADRPVEDLTLRELFTHSERLIRELTEHLEHAFIPETNNLRRMTKVGKTAADPLKTADKTIRNTAAKVLANEQFTHQLYQKLSSYLEAADHSVQRILDGT